MKAENRTTNGNELGQKQTMTLPLLQQGKNSQRKQ